MSQSSILVPGGRSRFKKTVSIRNMHERKTAPLPSRDFFMPVDFILRCILLASTAASVGAQGIAPRNADAVQPHQAETIQPR